MGSVVRVTRMNQFGTLSAGQHKEPVPHFGAYSILFMLMNDGFPPIVTSKCQSLAVYDLWNTDQREWRPKITRIPLRDGLLVLQTANRNVAKLARRNTEVRREYTC